MKCEQCGQVSDWVDGAWDAVNDGQAATYALYECERCGHRQMAR